MRLMLTPKRRDSAFAEKNGVFSAFFTFWTLVYHLEIGA